LRYDWLSSVCASFNPSRSPSGATVAGTMPVTAWSSRTIAVSFWYGLCQSGFSMTVPWYGVENTLCPSSVPKFGSNVT
jgi:hypothetical protein